LFSAAVLLVILSGLIHSIWNLFTKKSINKVVFLWFCQISAILIFLPLTIHEITENSPNFQMGWLYIFLSMLLHGIYVLLLAKVYSLGDLSQAYPIMRGISPLLVPIFAVLVLNEQLKLLGWFGIASIVFGILLIGGFKRKVLNQTMVYAIAVGVMITGYTLVDKHALHFVPPITLNEFSNIGNLLALSWIALHSGAIRQEWRVNWRTIILGGALAPGGYILFLKALELMPVSQLAPMREIGTVFGTFFGILLLKEPQGRCRIIASIFITAGIIVLAP
jgi:drug/metabolite transporter (DMT)-like permease